MRYIFAVLLALLGGCYQRVYAPYGEEQNNPHWFNWLSSGTHQVFVMCNGEPAGTGSGVLIAREGGTAYLATAAHVADPGCEYTVDGQALEMVAYDEYYDQAILAGPVAGRETDMGDVFVGQRVIVVGYPLQPFTGETEKQISHGGLTAFLGSRYKINADAYYGNSGGPCFNVDGDLVGLVVSMRVVSGVPVEWYVTPGWRTYELLEEALEEAD